MPLTLGVLATFLRLLALDAGSYRGRVGTPLSKLALTAARASPGLSLLLTPWPGPWILTLLHHANVHTALEAAGLAVAAVVLGDVAVPVEGTGEQRLPLHAAPAKRARPLHWVTHLPAPQP